MSQLTLFINFLSGERTNASTGEVFQQMLVGIAGAENGVSYSVGLNQPEARAFWATLCERAGYIPATNARGEVTGSKPADTIVRVACEGTIGQVRTDNEGAKRATVTITALPAEGFSLAPRGGFAPVPADADGVFARLFGTQSVSSTEAF